MQVAIRSIFSFVLLFSIGGCALFDKDDKEVVVNLPKPPYQRIYDAEFERVWRAVQVTLANYPIAINNMDAGILETEYVRSDKGWLSPEAPPIPPGGRKYKINIQVARGMSEDSNRQVIRVRVTKELVTQRDYFSDTSPLESDGLEEQSLLYRIERELEVDKGLDKAYKRINKKKK
jgi:hypothetical protein